MVLKNAGGWLRLLPRVTLPLYLADQLTKGIVLRTVDPGESLAVIPGFLNIVLVLNTGAAFGILPGANAFFVALSLLALGVLAAIELRKALPDPAGQWAAALLAAGVAGNLTDRVTRGAVVDFLDVILPFYGHWPAFNIADASICAAAGLFLLSGLKASKTVKEKPART